MRTVKGMGWRMRKGERGKDDGGRKEKIKSRGLGGINMNRIQE